LAAALFLSNGLCSRPRPGFPPRRVVWFASLALTAAMHAQFVRSSLKGTVIDSTGAGVPGATVTAVHEATGLERKTETSSQGTYTLDGLALGRYSIVFRKPGFSETRVTQVEQSIGEARALNVRLIPSTVTEKTTVTEPLVRVDTASAAVGAPIEKA
jgi:hypothetical protein